MSEIDFELFVSDANVQDGWFPLQTGDGSIWLHADTMNNTSVQLKRVTAANVYVPGTYTIRATQDNHTENVGVFVNIKSPRDREELVDYLVLLFTRPQFKVMQVMADVSYLHWCQASDYTINNQREYRHADLTLVQFKVPMLPRKETL